jgi:hypothetical protein
MNELIVSYQPFKITPQAINESMTRNNGRLIVEGILQTCNQRNHNNRIYERDILEREVDEYIKSQIKENRALGELDHPDSTIINLANVSHNIKEIWWNGDDVMGKIEILDTPAGKILTALFKAGILVGISSRGMGSVTQVDENTYSVNEDYKLLCWDFVSNPSTRNAFTRPIGITEGYIPENHVDRYHNANTIITDILCTNTGVCECYFK